MDAERLVIIGAEPPQIATSNKKSIRTSIKAIHSEK